MYISDVFCISPQKTYDDAFYKDDIITHAGIRYVALEPPYGTLIPGTLLRRMGKSVRMGAGAGLTLIKRNADLDGIILATANGGMEDCLKFLNQIVEYNEGTLTPTNFVQSTPNTIAGNLALMSKNFGYNITHVHEGLAFEGALLDVFLLFHEQKAKSLLLGSIDEISDYNHHINFLAGAYKTEETNSETLLDSHSAGTVNGEGASMFVVESERTDNSIARILDADQISYTTKSVLHERLHYFLKRNKLVISDIDALILGYNGDIRTDHWYSNLHEQLFSHASVYCFKNLTGDYPTASGFAAWLAVQILTGKNMPSRIKLAEHGHSRQVPENILIYNHYKGMQHGFILMTA